MKEGQQTVSNKQLSTLIRRNSWTVDRYNVSSLSSTFLLQNIYRKSKGFKNQDRKKMQFKQNSLHRGRERQKFQALDKNNFSHSCTEYFGLNYKLQKLLSTKKCL